MIRFKPFFQPVVGEGIHQDQDQIIQLPAKWFEQAWIQSRILKPIYAQQFSQAGRYVQD